MTAVATKLRARATEITITTDQRDVVDKAERAVDAVRPRCIYQRGRMLVHVVTDAGAPGWLNRPGGAPVIVRVGKERLREELGSAAKWLTPTKDGPRETTVPPWVGGMLGDRGQWIFPPLEGISDTPVLRPDGTIHATPGYDAASRIIYDPCGVVFPPVPERPERKHAVRALGELLEPFGDFPYVDASDRMAVGAAILTVIGRCAIDGNTPMSGFCATTPGSGKGLQVDAVAIIATGRIAPKMAPTSDDNEWRKRLLAIAIESPAMVVVDNVEGSFGSPALAMALTTGSVSERVLGVSENRTASLRSVWAYTGNNVQLKGDLGRRVVPIDIDPRVEHPEDRHEFRHADLLAYVRAERPRLVIAALTVLRAFYVAGCPSHGKPAKGSYEAWDKLVRGAIIWAGGADPLGGVQRIRERADDDLDRLRAMLGAWESTLGTTFAMSVADALKKADAGDGALRDAFAAYARPGTKIDGRQLGYALRKVTGRIVGGLYIEPQAENRNGAVMWRVREVAAAGNAGNAGDRLSLPDLKLDLSSAGASPASPASPAEVE